MNALELDCAITTQACKAEYIGVSSTPKDLLALAAKAYSNAILKSLEDVAKIRAASARRLKGIKNRVKSIGYKTGRIKAEQVYLSRLIQSNLVARTAIIRSNNDVFDLAVMIAKKVIQDELTSNPKTISKRIESALSSLLNTTKITISVNPSDKNNLRCIASYPSCSIQCIDSIPKGDAIIETPSGCIQLSLSDHIDHLTSELKSSLEKKLNEP